MSQTFAVMDVNPNVGHGCLCSEIGTQDSHGPFVVFSATELDTIESPFPVLCSGCALRASQLIHYEMSPDTPEFRQVEADDNEIVLPKPRTVRAEDVPGPLNSSPAKPKRSRRSLEDGPSI